MSFFNRSRTYIAAQGVGIAQGALEMALRHTKKRMVFGKPLASSELVQVKLAEMATLTEAARNLTYKAAWKVDKGIMDPALTSMAKWYAAEVGVKVVDEALQLHGGYGYIDEYDISRFYRDAKIPPDDTFCYSVIVDNLILETITEKKPIIEPVTENMPPERPVINALRNTPSEMPLKTIFGAGGGYLPICFVKNGFLKWEPSSFICGSLNNHRQMVLQVISRLSTSMSNIKTKDLDRPGMSVCLT